MNILKDILTILTSLNIVDYILYFGVILLMCLVVSLIYVLKNEKEDNKDVVSNTSDELDLKDIVKEIDEKPAPIVDMTRYEEEQEQKAIISYDELVKSTQNTLSYQKEEMVDDVIPVKQIQVMPMELPKIKDGDNILDSLNITQKEPKFEVDSNKVETQEFKLFSYEKEEAFLKALKELNEILNLIYNKIMVQ